MLFKLIDERVLIARTLRSCILLGSECACVLRASSCTAQSARALSSLYIWLQLHKFYSQSFSHPCTEPLWDQRYSVFTIKTWLELDQYLVASPPVIYPQASDNRLIVEHNLITGCICFPNSSCYWTILASGRSSSPPKERHGVHHLERPNSLCM